MGDTFSPLKVKAIISRYTTNSTGGAEKHARDILQLLPSEWEVEVFTSCAEDYQTWKNTYPEGESWDGGILIRRFRSKKERKIRSFNRHLDRIRNLHQNQTLKEEEKWIEEQGPFCPNLVKSLLISKDDTDVFIFFSYLYYPIVKGLEFLASKSIFIPMLHDELPAYFSIYKKAFTDSIYYAFNTPEEANLFQRIFGFTPSLQSIIGTYIEEPQSEEAEKYLPTSENIPAPSTKIQLSTKIPSPNDGFDKKFNSPYIFTLGRMDIGKGYLELIEYVNIWNSNSDQKITLLVAGKNPTQFQKKYQSDTIQFLGYISDEEKYTLMKNAILFINPSQLESFSIVIMEAWLMGAAVLVNGNSDVLKGHCVRSNGGLYYRDLDSFLETIHILSKDPNLRKRMGSNGRKYVIQNFNRSLIREKLLNTIQERINTY